MLPLVDRHPVNLRQHPVGNWEKKNCLGNLLYHWSQGALVGLDLLVSLRKSILLLLPCLPGLCTLLLRLSCSAFLSAAFLSWGGTCLPGPLHLEHDPAVHKPSLQEADGQEGCKSDQGGVVVPSGGVQHLQLCWDWSKAKPEGKNWHGDRREPSNNKEGIAQLEELWGNGRFVKVGQDAACVEDCLRDVVHQEKEEGDACEWGDIGGQDESKVEATLRRFSLRTISPAQTIDVM